MKIAAFSLTVFAAALLSPAASWSDEKNESLIGTWKLVSAKYGGKEYQYPTGSTTLKHVTPTQFMWVTYDAKGEITRSAGGTCVRNGDRYEETSQYGFNAGLNLKSENVHTFTCKVEGNKWHHEGKLASGLTIEEVWMRDEKK